MTADNRDLMAVAKSLDDMGVSYIELPRLAEPTPEKEIEWREGPKGKMLAYIDARYVMNLLDRIVGPENWQNDHKPVGANRVAAGIGINVAGIGWVWKWDGAGETDIEGEKGAFSDSFKRAAVKWGIARDLYDKDGGRVGASSAPVADAVRTASPRPPAAAASREPDYWDREADQGGGGTCPNHGKPWTLGQYGWYCKSKATGDQPANARGYCTLKPSAAWMARQEVA